MPPVLDRGGQRPCKAITPGSGSGIYDRPEAPGETARRPRTAVFGPPRVFFPLACRVAVRRNSNG